VSMPTHPLLEAVAAIAGESLTEFLLDYAEELEGAAGDPVDRDALGRAVNVMKTRIGLAPALSAEDAAQLSEALSVAELPAVGGRELNRWLAILRKIPEAVPFSSSATVGFPPLPDHQVDMWHTILGIEELGVPWVLVGGQMTILHCLEHGVTPPRATDDGDVVVGVWTRRNALNAATSYLLRQGFREDQTADGLGYRYRKGTQSTIDVLLPEGLRRQRIQPRTATSRRGFSAVGSNQALTRAEKVRVNIAGRSGIIRRPTLQGSIVAKASAFVADSRDAERHVEDVVVLADIAAKLGPRSILHGTRATDRARVRHMLDAGLGREHPAFSLTEDPEGVYNLLERMGGRS
jgi:hypothetical protein